MYLVYNSFINLRNLKIPGMLIYLHIKHVIIIQRKP